jgi:multidrug resistance protein MdtO
MTSDEMSASAPLARREREWTPARSWLLLLHDELSDISPVRWSRMLRVTALVALVTIISMALRVPEAAISAYMIFFVSKPDVAATVRVGLGGILAVTVAVALTLICYLLALSEPALRLPVMACLTFAGMYAMRSSPVGVLGFLIGFVTAYALTLVDRGYGPEFLTRGILWIWVVIGYPTALLIITEGILGQRPADLFRQGLASRLEAAAEYLRSAAGSDASSRRRVERLERAGTGDIAPYVKDRSPSITAARGRVVRQLDLLFLLLRELPDDAKRAPAVRRALARAADVCLHTQRAVLGEEDAPTAPPALTGLDEPGMASGSSPAALAVVLPLLGCVEDLALAVRDARGSGAPSTPGAAHEEENPPPPAASPTKTTESVRFALKVTLAAMSA